MKIRKGFLKSIGFVRYMAKYCNEHAIDTQPSACGNGSRSCTEMEPSKKRHTHCALKGLPVSQTGQPGHRNSSEATEMTNNDSKGSRQEATGFVAQCTRVQNHTGRGAGLS